MYVKNVLVYERLLPIAYKNDDRKIVKVGVNYSSEQKQLTEWVIE